MSEQTLYVYCITEGISPPDVESGLGTVTYHDLHAVVRPADPGEFEGLEPDGDGEVPAALADLLHRHDRVVRAVFAAHTVLPMRFGVGVVDADGLRAYLQEEYDDLKSRLERLRDHEEWGVRWEPAEPETATGRGYLRSRYQALRAGQDRIRRFRSEVERAHRLLAKQATAVSPGAKSGGEIACAYLVRRSEAEAFLLVATVLDDELTTRGITMRLTGPWPCYSFASGHEPGDNG